jgi:hypothetical protein
VAPTELTQPLTAPAKNASEPLLPQWSKQLSIGNDGFARAVEAISGNPVGDDMRRFLLGVTTIERCDDGNVKLTREDNESIVLSHGSGFGDRILNAVEQAPIKATKKFGKPVGDMVTALTSVHLDGNRVMISREGPPDVPISLSRQKQERKLWVKQLKLGDLAFDVVEDSGRQNIRNITGFTAVLDALDMSVELRDFSRWLNKDGLNVYQVGVKNPFASPITTLFGLPEVLHLKFTEHGRSGKKLASDDGGLSRPHHKRVRGRHRQDDRAKSDDATDTINGGCQQTTQQQ